MVISYQHPVTYSKKPLGQGQKGGESEQMPSLSEQGSELLTIVDDDAPSISPAYIKAYIRVSGSDAPPSSSAQESELLTIVGSSEEAAGKTLAQSARDAAGRERNYKLRRLAAYVAARVVVDLRGSSFALARDYEAAVRAEAEACMDSDMAAFTVARVASHKVHVRQLRAARKQAKTAGLHSLRHPSLQLSFQSSNHPSLQPSLSAEHSVEPSVEPSAEPSAEPSVEHSFSRVVDNC